ncbi:PAS domain-containing sensor histidine kinase [Desulfobacula toluolica]|uniref:histidine kinase n=1 Tax=Desulfobacula toluolica (strain DSM 7467 / Tol2) TaxID=651182 RepID=K0NE80_DESTT|nr:PAS domain S-box protein [Desulfobacula toluolica]CCK79140.1 sensor histidine kinase protein [Desulfobacula toluolica Tol2]
MGNKKEIPDNSELRQRAEKALKVSSVNNDCPVEFSPDEMKTLIHDLEVHQIELEMQNDELRRFQAELYTERARYFDLYNMAPVGFFSINEQKLIFECNLTAAKMLGTTRSTIVKQPVTRFILKEDQDIYYLHNKQLFETDVPQECDLRMLKNNGSAIWVRLATTVVQNSEGITSRRMVMSDITERKKVENILKERETFLKTLINAIPIPVFYKDKKGRYLEFNEAFEVFFGKKREDLIGKSVFDISPRHLAEKYTAQDNELFAIGGKQQYESQVKNTNGKLRDVIFSTSVVPGNKGSFIGLIGAILDITDRKRDEEDISNLRNYLSNIIDSMPSVIIGVDKDGRVNQWNHKAQIITGISKESAKGQLFEKAFPLLSSESERLKQAISMRKICSNPRQFRKEEDQVIFENITIYPLTANGRAGAVVRVDDVTEQVKLEEMMVQSEKMLSLGGFSAAMAHEINNPLAGVIQNTNVLSNRLTMKDMPANIKAAESSGTTMEAIHEFMHARKVPRMLEAITESGLRIADIVRNILSFSRKSDSFFSTHNPKVLMEKILALASSGYDLKKKFDFKSIVIEKKYEKDLPVIVCRGSEIQQVLLNVFNNGAYAMFEKQFSEKDYQPKFCLKLSEEREFNMLRIEVKDNGPGIDKETCKRIFEPFFTTKPIGSGTGLGLSVSYFIITKNHNGTMEVESELGKGTNFIIRLPMGACSIKDKHLFGLGEF